MGSVSGVDTLRWSIEGAIGTMFDDVFLGNDSPNVFYGMAGKDYIDSWGGDDVLCGGVGDDTLLAGWGNDLVVWAEGEGNDTIDMGDDEFDDNDTAPAPATDTPAP